MYISTCMCHVGGVLVPVGGGGGGGRQQQLRVVAPLTVSALGASQQRHHDLVHVPVEDVRLVGPLGKVVGYGEGGGVRRGGHVLDVRHRSFPASSSFPLR